MDHMAWILLLERVAGDLSAWRLFWAGCAGILLGMLVAVLACVLLGRSGWLARRRRWHHYLLKFYFLLLPLAGAAIGLQAALYINAERQLHERVEEARADVQQAADALLASSEAYLREASMPAVTREHSLEDVLGMMVDDYLQENPLFFPGSGEDGLMQRAARKGVEMFQASLLTRLASDQAVKEAASYSGLSEETLKKVVATRFEELLSADFVLDLAKDQVSALMLGFHLSVLLQVLLLGLLVGGECLLARRLGWRPEQQAQGMGSNLVPG